MGMWLAEWLTRQTEPEDAGDREVYYREWRWLTWPVRVPFRLLTGRELRIPGLTLTPAQEQAARATAHAAGDGTTGEGG